MLLVLVALLAAPAALARDGAGGDRAAHLAPLARVSVVGSGPIAWANVAVRSAPRRDAAVVARLTQFRPDYRPRTILALDERQNAAGQATWYRVSVPGRPNGRTGWIPAAAASVAPVDRWLVVYRGSRKFELYVNGRLRRTGPIAVGAPGMETPLGLYYVTVRFKPIKEPFLGAFAFETSAYSKLSDWPGGGVVGLHGWNDPSVLGKAISHGCIRVSNVTAAFLRDRIPVGTPIRVVAT